MSPYLRADVRKKIIPLKDTIVENFTLENWLELGTVTGCTDLVRNHDRLLRSMRFGDEDYAGCVLDVLFSIVQREEANFDFIQDYVNSRFGNTGINVSSVETDAPRIVFQPTVFKVPTDQPDPDLVSAMMPFSEGFKPVYSSIESAASRNFMRCQRADNIWQESAVIQDIFGLIFRSFIVVCDFTGKNPNVFYEAGIAHTLGKHVIPITQSAEDIPFDLRHHRYIAYLNNGEGRAWLEQQLVERINTLKQQR